MVSSVKNLSLLFPLTLLAAACGSSDSPAGSSTGDAGLGDAAASNDGGVGPVDDGDVTNEGGAPGDDASVGEAGAVPDKTPPTIVSTFPAEVATGQATTTSVTVTFSEEMASQTLTPASFRLAQGATAVPGVVTYSNDVATFNPSADLALSTVYTATVTTAATDLAGNALATEHSWTFTTDVTAAVGPAPVHLGAAGPFAILAKSAISNVPTSAITGNLGLSPAAASYITGFALTRAGTKWTSPQVVGSIFAADNDPPTPTNLTTAIGDMQTAYTDAAGRPTPTSLNLGAGAIGGMTLTPGLYKWTSSVTVPSDVTLSGAANDTWIFQITGDLTVSAAKKMILLGGAQAKNIVWQVAGAVDLGTTSHGEGIVLSKTAITLETGASLNGRLLAQTAVHLAGNAVTAPAP